jgi:hypothetical protein
MSHEPTRTGHREEVIPFTAGDGFPLSLVHVQGEQPPTRGPVLLVHGAGVRANLFRPPVQRTLVDALIDHGYDVWLENWRASIAHPANPWTLDEAALYDHPEAVKEVARRTGAAKLKALIHCQGSTSFTMSAVAGLVPQVNVIVSNAVSLHPVVPAWSQWKLAVAVPLMKQLTPYLNPHWGVYAPNWVARAVVALVRATHHECDNTACKMVSFTYGSGFPALWKHENLNAETHAWIAEEFGDVSMRFFSQMSRCVRKGWLVAYDGKAGLPQDFTASPPQTDARFAFFAGHESGCFLPESQVRSHEYFSSFRKDFHTLHVIP